VLRQLVEAVEQHQIVRAYASDDAIKVDFMIKVKERAIGMGNRRRA
jgi:hypothetical protein